MKLEIGKRYVRRDGHITGPLKHDPRADDYAFYDFRTEFSYTDEGHYWLTKEEDQRDLVQEYIEPQKENPTTKPHKYADLLRALAEDSEAKMWIWSSANQVWWRVHEHLLFDANDDDDDVFFVSRTKPTAPPAIPRKQITLAGRTFDAPLTDVPEIGSEYWIPRITEDDFEGRYFWDGSRVDVIWLERGLIHTTETAARAHAEALIELTKQAVENAK